jgi:hypothetical protein
MEEDFGHLGNEIEVLYTKWYLLGPRNENLILLQWNLSNPTYQHVFTDFVPIIFVHL